MSKAKNSKHLKLTPKILLKAQQTARIIKDQLFTDANTTAISVGASLDMDQLEPVIFENIDDHMTACYGGLFFDSLNTDSKMFSVFRDVFFTQITKG